MTRFSVTIPGWMWPSPSPPTSKRPRRHNLPAHSAVCGAYASRAVLSSFFNLLLLLLYVYIYVYYIYHTTPLYSIHTAQCPDGHNHHVRSLNDAMSRCHRGVQSCEELSPWWASGRMRICIYKIWHAMWVQMMSQNGCESTIMNLGHFLCAIRWNYAAIIIHTWYCMKLYSLFSIFEYLGFILRSWCWISGEFIYRKGIVDLNHMNNMFSICWSIMWQKNLTPTVYRSDTWTQHKYLLRIRE